MMSAVRAVNDCVYTRGLHLILKICGQAPQLTCIATYGILKTITEGDDHLKKVALVTCFLDNYCACLQALALQTQIKKLCCACDILAYIGNSG